MTGRYRRVDIHDGVAKKQRGHEQTRINGKIKPVHIEKIKDNEQTGIHK